MVGYDHPYEVSSDGRVRTLDRVIIKPARSNARGGPATIKSHEMCMTDDGCGYLRVKVHKGGVVKMAKVHRLVALAFLDNPENKAEVNHKDGNKKNNSVSNLEWATRLENMQHAWRTGLNDTKGERNVRSKISEDTAKQIKSLLSVGLPRYKVAQKVGASWQTVNLINRGITWKHV